MLRVPVASSAVVAAAYTLLQSASLLLLLAFCTIFFASFVSTLEFMPFCCWLIVLILLLISFLFHLFRFFSSQYIRCHSIFLTFTTLFRIKLCFVVVVLFFVDVCVSVHFSGLLIFNVGHNILPAAGSLSYAGTGDFYLWL